MNKEVNENWIDIYIKNKPFSYKGSIIAHCRKMDKADVYEWIAEDELKICQLKQKVNQLETNRDEAIDILKNFDVFKEFSFPLMKRDEESQVKSSIDYELKTTLYKQLKSILERGKE